MKKKALIAITGGISAYKVADVISGLKANNFEVRVIATESALKFITPTVIGSISNGNYITESDPNVITHIDEAQNCDVFICVPATANTIAKFNLGLADNLVTSTFIALPKNTPKIICPAMNTKMWENNTTQKHLSGLRLGGCKVIQPVKGLLACGDIGMGKLPKPRAIVKEILEVMDKREPWAWPLHLSSIGTSNDSYSYLHINLQQDVEVPLYPHVGAFGAKRRHDTHRGVDLYAPVGTKVRAVEDGVVCIEQGIRPWTGKIARCDWWENTWAIIVEGKSGMVVYGEIKIDEAILKKQEELDIKKMDELRTLGFLTFKLVIEIKKGQLLGTVLNVLKKDKGRPMSMLHLELREPGFYRNIDKKWDKIPKGIIDPTPFLIRSSIKKN